MTGAAPGEHLHDDEVAGELARESLITQDGLEKLKAEIEHLSTDAGERSPRGSRRRASSATSPRTPSTTTPRTSRRCSSSGSPSSRSGCAARPWSTSSASTRLRRRRRPGPRQGPEVRRLAASSTSSALPRPTSPRGSSPTSPRSGVPSWATSAATSSPSRPPRAQEEAQDHQDRVGVSRCNRRRRCPRRRSRRLNSSLRRAPTSERRGVSS